MGTKDCPADGLRELPGGGTLGGAMIHDVDESLRALVKRDALNGTRVDIAFDAPTNEWSARQNAPTVNLYLYDIREDLQRREVNWEPHRDPNGRVAEHRPPARHYRLSYLVTAWTQRPEDEHRLLSAMLAAFLRHPILPADLAAGSLAESAIPVFLTVALPPPQDRSLADVWSALGGELKPSLDLVVTAPIDVSMRIEAGPPVLEQPRFHVVRADGSVENVEYAAGAEGHRPTGSGGRKLSPDEQAVQDESVLAGAPKPAGEPGTGRGSTSGRRSAKPSGKPQREVPGQAGSGRRLRVRGISRP